MKAVSLPYTEEKVYQTINGHPITSDTQFLVESILNHKNSFPGGQLDVLEIGTGTGIVAIMLSLARPEWSVLAVEVQISEYLLALKNISAVNAKLNLKLADVRKLHDYIGNRQFHLIVSNPPYYKVGSGRTAVNIAKNISRFEFLSEMDDFFRCLRRHLLPGGLAAYLYPVSRSEEIDMLVERYNFRLAGSKTINTEHKSQSGNSDPKALFFVGKKDNVPNDEAVCLALDS